MFSRGLKTGSLYNTYKGVKLLAYEEIQKLTWENTIKDANDKMIQMLELSDMTSNSCYRTAQTATVKLLKQMLKRKVKDQQGLPRWPSVETPPANNAGEDP